MNNDFQTWYLALLRKQVEEEIQFLVTNGHDNTFVPVPCMFCIEHHTGKHHCRRLKDLREFHSSIIGNIRNSATKSGRRAIGAEPQEIVSDEFNTPTETPIFQLK